MVTPIAPPRNGQQVEPLQALYTMAVELSALRSLKSVLDTALQHCLKLTGSQFGFVGLNTPEGRALDVAAIQGFHPSAHFYNQHHRIPLRPNIFARAVLENRPVRTHDAMTDPGRVGQPRGHPPVGTFLGVPLRIRDEPIGMIGVANRPEAYREEHEQLLLTYAAQVAIVIRNAQLYEQLTAAKAELEQKVADRTAELQEAKEALARKAAQLQQLFTETVDIEERERQRIAQDMHDGINQLLIGAMLEMKSARKRLDTGNLGLVGQSLQATQEILHRVDGEMRRIVFDLRPPTLDSLGLVPALRRCVAQFEQYAGISCAVLVQGEAVRLPSRVETSIYRLAQEALQNVCSHSQARGASLAIAFSPRQLRLAIEDNGLGFDPDNVAQDNGRHFGLLSMRERAESLGGRLTIQARPGQGTHIELLLPLDAGNGTSPADDS